MAKGKKQASGKGKPRKSGASAGAARRAVADGQDRGRGEREAPRSDGRPAGDSARVLPEEEVVRFSPLFNDAFLFLFGREVSKGMTLSLLNAVLDLAGLPEVGEVYAITADAAMPGGVKCRTGRCDVVVMSDGTIYDIESQGRHANVVNKSLFYGAKILTENAPRGGSGTYDNLPQAVMITLLHDRVLLPGSERFIHVGQVDWDGSAGPATDRLVFVMVEMDKLARMYTIRSGEIWESESLAWLYLLARGYADTGEMEALMKRFDTMIDFAEYYGIAIGDPTLKRQYDKYIEVCMERNSEISAMRREAEEEARRVVEQELRRKVEQGILKGREQGIERGREQGREKEREAIAGRMREMGMDEDTIARALG